MGPMGPMGPMGLMGLMGLMELRGFVVNGIAQEGSGVYLS